MTNLEKEPEFMQAKVSKSVLINGEKVFKIISIIGCARDPDAPTLFQVENVDTGEIKFVHAAGVKQILNS